MNDTAPPPGRLDEINDEWAQLDHERYDLLVDQAPKFDQPDRPRPDHSERVAEINARFKELFLEKQRILQGIEPLGAAELEAQRLEGLAYHVEKSGYRLSDWRFLYEKRWWEPGYLDS